ncbi:MAG: hypothetical protein KDA85_03900 [Planctomycetaceae bacterium]|nr:hypothetical protein [Planctomycetaceae bacterium]
MATLNSEQEIRNAARTVTDVAQHFTQLRQRVVAMLSELQASTRGFFTPEEDNQVRQVLVSYWTARNALFELILSLRHNDQREAALQIPALMTGYAGALVLVDAARFLRESFHNRPVVRAKLNEPEPHFALPEGIYNRIQQSLTNPYHIWHLYHAGKAVELHADAVASAAQTSPELEPIPELIERLQERLNVSPRSYAVAGIRSQARSLRAIVETRLLWRAMYGLQKFVSQLISGHYIRPGHIPALPEHIRSELTSQLQPGDILVTRKEHALTNYFLPGFWPHVALYLGTVDQLKARGLDQQPPFHSRWKSLLDCDSTMENRVLESLKDGVRIRSLMCPLSSDAVAVLRPRLPADSITSALTRGMFHEGKPYDFDFDFTRSDRLVCTEVVYRSYEGIDGLRFELTRRAGRLTLSAEDLLHQALRGEGFSVHAVFCPGHSASVEYSGAAEDMIRKTAAPDNHSTDAENAR